MSAPGRLVSAGARPPRGASGPLRRRDAALARDASFGPSMTPMVDVVLVILIFFMASTAFVGPEWLLRSALPGQGSGGSGGRAFALPPARFDLRLEADADGSTRVTGLGLERAPLSAGQERLRAYADRLGPAQMTVILVPSADVAYSDVVRLHETCAALGIEGVGLR